MKHLLSRIGIAGIWIGIALAGHAAAADAPRVYVGGLGSYNVAVVRISLSDQNVQGTYYYARHAKPLELKGVRNPDTGEYLMSETWSGKITGHWRVTITDDGIKGIWTSPERTTEETMDLANIEKGNGFREVPATEPVDLKRLPIEANPKMDARGKAIEGDYAHHGQTWCFEYTDNMEIARDEKGEYIRTFAPATERMRIQYIGDGYFSFYCNVVGGNAHMGSMTGIARMTGLNTAEFHGVEDALLGFQFKRDRMITREIRSCSHYAGMRAGFNQTFMRQK